MITDNTVTKAIESLTTLLEGAKNQPVNCRPYMEGYIDGLQHALQMMQLHAQVAAENAKFEAELKAIRNCAEVA